MVYSSDLPLNGKGKKNATEKSIQTSPEAYRTETVRTGGHATGQQHTLILNSMRNQPQKNGTDSRSSPATL